ncbi:bifunctional glutamate N-acetyltransferase/amino-acid acetyltransferase ArgJ [Teredinibacter purpureus]|uniref:bifunctional glutamate N-acetyltransferase/amino-acid acetyltransferase ArgJ n=1 Tax=Teredinibacter purpureus TaxID=2731756 RepID=UPI0005F8205F|nr:bifunctional glutamate N-acetyltransferase/amino-acid acetyltransferase ArgJ [Teredinibacter purpureus]
MAVGNGVWPTVFPVAGVRLGVAAAGVKYTDRNDVVLLEIAEGSEVAGVFTQNAFCAAPVTLAKQHLGENTPRYFLINSGNANACTGDAGFDAAQETMSAVARVAKVSINQVLPFSTGVIGEPLPSSKIVAAIPQAYEQLDVMGWELAATTIMTTDTRPKASSVRINIGGETVSITGISKGSGMIRPNMATMLAYIATDAAIDADTLRAISLSAANKSFNRITIDGDTSTNDACMLIATGQSSAKKIERPSGEAFEKIRDAIIDVYKNLAQQIVRDGEGATKFVTVNVSGGKSNSECLQVAYAIAHSPLVKTALFASDPNWGRIVAAIGYAGIDSLDPSRVSVSLDDVQIVKNGSRAVSYLEESGQAIFNQPEFSINVALGRGEASETLWTSDLSHEYVTINAEYRT